MNSERLRQAVTDLAKRSHLAGAMSRQPEMDASGVTRAAQGDARLLVEAINELDVWRASIGFMPLSLREALRRGDVDAVAEWRARSDEFVASLQDDVAKLREERERLRRPERLWWLVFMPWLAGLLMIETAKLIAEALS